MPTHRLLSSMMLHGQLDHARCDHDCSTHLAVMFRCSRSGIPVQVSNSPGRLGFRIFDAKRSFSPCASNGTTVPYGAGTVCAQLLYSPLRRPCRSVYAIVRMAPFIMVASSQMRVVLKFRPGLYLPEGGGSDKSMIGILQVPDTAKYSVWRRKLSSKNAMVCFFRKNTFLT